MSRYIEDRADLVRVRIVADYAHDLRADDRFRNLGYDARRAFAAAEYDAVTSVEKADQEGQG